MSDRQEEKVGRYRVRGRGFLIDSGILVDSGVFIDSAAARRIPIFLLDWPVELPSGPGEPLEVMCLGEPVSIRSTDKSGRKEVTILPKKKPQVVRRIGTDEATGHPLYEHVRYPGAIPEPEYAKVEYKYDRDQGEVNEAAIFEFGNKTNGFVRVEGVDYQVIVLNVDGDRSLKTDGEYLVVAEDKGVLPLGAIYVGRLIGKHDESGSPLFEGEPAKLPTRRRRKRRPDN